MDDVFGFRAGDTVRHGPTGEEWILACDEEDGRVWWVGWPEGQAEASDCLLLTRAGGHEHLDMLRRVSKTSAGGRQRLAQRQLAEGGAGCLIHGGG